MSLPLRSHFLIHNSSSDCLRCLFRRLRRYASLLLLAAMVMVSVPPAIAQSTLKEAASRLTLQAVLRTASRVGSICWPHGEKAASANVRIAECPRCQSIHRVFVRNHHVPEMSWNPE